MKIPNPFIVNTNLFTVTMAVSIKFPWCVFAYHFQVYICSIKNLGPATLHIFCFIRKSFLMHLISFLGQFYYFTFSSYIEKFYKTDLLNLIKVAFLCPFLVLLLVICGLPLQPHVAYLHPLKTENLKVFWCFQRL